MKITASLALSLASIAMLMAGCASAPPVEAIKDSPSEHHGSVRVINHHCDGSQGVDGLLLNVESEGPVIIRWSNEGVCGKAA